MFLAANPLETHGVSSDGVFPAERLRKPGLPHHLCNHLTPRLAQCAQKLAASAKFPGNVSDKGLVHMTASQLATISDPTATTTATKWREE